MNNRKKIWIDCDPGIDDAGMLALAFASENKLQILGISTVAGNQTSDRVTDNAVKLVHLLGREDTLIARGARGPLVRGMVDAGDIHGESGLGYSNMDLPKAKVHPNGIVAMVNAIMSLPEDEKITLVATGPLTNIALLLKVFPEVKGGIEQIVLMGGSTVGGNITSASEFNIWEDPEAAKMVFESQVPIVMCAIDVTRYCYLTRDQIEDLGKSAGRVSQEYYKMFSFYLDTTKQEAEGNVIIHDAATILYLTEPELFDGSMQHIDVELYGEMSRGMTICDLREDAEGNRKPANVLLLDRADTEVFQRRILDAIASYDV